MAIIRTTHLYEFVGRLEGAADATSAPVLGIQVSRLERFTEDGVVLIERPLQPVRATFEELADLLDDGALASLEDAAKKAKDKRPKP